MTVMLTPESFMIVCTLQTVWQVTNLVDVLSMSKQTPFTEVPKEPLSDSCHSAWLMSTEPKLGKRELVTFIDLWLSQGMKARSLQWFWPRNQQLSISGISSQSERPKCFTFLYRWSESVLHRANSRCQSFGIQPTFKSIAPPTPDVQRSLMLSRVYLQFHSSTSTTDTDSISE